MNKHLIMGRLGNDPDVRALPDGTTVCSFSVATSEKYKDKEYTEWHNVVAFGSVAEIIAKFFKKGDGIALEGKSKTRSWEKDGQKYYKVEIEIRDFWFPPGKSSQSQQASTATEREPGSDDGADDEDIPF